MDKSDNKKGPDNKPDQKKDGKHSVNQGRFNSPALNNSSDQSNKNSMLLPADLKLGRDDAFNERDIEI